MALSYNELKEKVLRRYGNIDNIPDSVYNAMISYRDNGTAALDDDKVFDILVSERDYKFNQPEKSAIAEQMRRDAKTQYADDVANQNREFWAEGIKPFAPRYADLLRNNELSLGKGLAAGLFDFGSAPGRSLGSVVAGGATVLGSVFGGSTLGDAFTNAIAAADDFAATKGADKGEGFLRALPEEIVKDPLGPLAYVIPAGAASSIAGKVIPQLGKFGSKIRPVVAPAIEGAIQGTQNLVAGLGERFVDKNQEGSAAMDAGLGFVLGGAGKGASDLIKYGVDSKIGSEIFHKFTNTERTQGKQKMLLNQLQKAYPDVNFVDKDGKIDPSKLGNLLREMSSNEYSLPRNRILSTVRNQEELAGRQLGHIYKDIDKSGRRFNVDNILKSVESDYKGSSIGDLKSFRKNEEIGNFIKQLDNLSKDVGFSVRSEYGPPESQKIFDLREFNKLKEDIQNLYPIVNKIEPDPHLANLGIDDVQLTHIRHPEVTTQQLRDIRDNLFQREKPFSMAGETTKAQLAGDIRTAMADDINATVDEFIKNNPEKYGDLQSPAAKSSVYQTLEDLATKSDYFNAKEKPRTFRSTTSEVFDFAKQTPIVAIEKPIITKSAKHVLQSQVRANSREVDDRKEGYPSNLSDGDTRILARAQDALRFNPNDKDALSIVNYYKQKGPKE